MQLYNYNPPMTFEEGHERFLRTITNDYIFQAPEYPAAWEFREILKYINMPFLDYDPYILDDFEFHNGIIQSCWTIFFTARPEDVDRLNYIVRHLKHGGVIYDEIPWK